MIFQDDTIRIEEYFDGRPISIWEMRNKNIYARFAEMICHYNFNQRAKNEVQMHSPLDVQKLYFHQVLDKWAPSVLERIEDMKKELEKAGQRQHVDVLSSLQATFLFDGFDSHFRDMVPAASDTFPAVLCHNDVLANNLLMGRSHNQHLLLIDYEYTGWNPMAMDLANWVNECMLDNAYPYGTGSYSYVENKMDIEEIENMAKIYMRTYFENYAETAVKSKYEDSDQFLKTNLAEFVRQIEKCCLLNNLFWGVLAISILQPGSYAAQGDWNYEYAAHRIKMYEAMKGK